MNEKEKLLRYIHQMDNMGVITFDNGFDQMYCHTSSDDRKDGLCPYSINGECTYPDQEGCPWSWEDDLDHLAEYLLNSENS